MANSFAHLYLVEPSPRARRLFWHLWSIGAVALDEPDRHEGLDKPGAHLFWVQSGKGVLEVPEQSYSLKLGPKCWLVEMKKPRTYAPLPGRRIINMGFRFGGPELAAWREELGEGHEFVLDEADFRSIRKAGQKLGRLVRRRPAGYEWEVHVLLTQILGKLLKARRVFSSPQLDVPKPLARAVSLVMADPSRDWKVPELADAAGASRSGLQRMFKIFQQESIHEFLQRTRLDQARQLLCDERLAIKEVSARLSFSSEFYFSRFFRKKTGMSPRQFRESTKV
jgi:AraC-like DNA-binding protein